MTTGPGRVLITGVTGFIGAHVARHFARHHWSVAGVDRTPASGELLGSLASFHCLGLPSGAFGAVLREARPQVCLHCAGSASVPGSISDPGADFRANTVLTFEVLDSLRLDAPRCRFVLLSSAAVYGNPASLPVTETQPPAPVSPYGFHKWQCEQLCREFSDLYGLPTSIVRIFSAYGPGLRRQVIWDICEKAFSQQPVVLHGTGRESRDFVHVADIAAALMLVANSPRVHGEVFNLACGRETTISELARLVTAALGCSREVAFDGNVPPGTPLNWRADIARLRALGFDPSVPLEEGVATVADWYLSETRRR